jgi:capsular polysaccharide biosynthesis protein
MSDQPLDLRKALQIVRRHKIQVGALAVLGLVLGGGYAVAKPPPYSSQALVAIPLSTSASSQQATTPNGLSSGTETQVVVAGSDPVLIAALANIHPSPSLAQLRNEVTVTGVTDSVIGFTGKAKTAGQAESIANAVASSYVAYVGSSSSPVGKVQAQLFESATSASGGQLGLSATIDGLAGLFVGALAGFLIALLRGRGDRRLRQRDEIANSIGVPVIADIPVAHPSDAPGWTRLLDEYEPGPVQAWRLRTMVEQLGISDMTANGSRGATSLTVVTLSTDGKAVALGPQIATFAAALGIPTALVIGPQQDSASAATLRTACAADAGIRHSKPLRVVVSDDGRFSDPRAALVVVVVVVDGRSPKMPDTMSTTATLLGVSSGGATAEQLASAATAAVADGHDIVGILVADPDPEDKTTGRIPRLGRSGRHPQPNRLKGIPTETIR